MSSSIGTSNGNGSGSGKVPTWAGFVLALLVPLATFAMGYGKMQAAIEQVTELVYRLERDIGDNGRTDRETEGEIRREIEKTADKITKLDRNIVRICAALKTRCEE